MQQRVLCQGPATGRGSGYDRAGDRDHRDPDHYFSVDTEEDQQAQPVLCSLALVSVFCFGVLCACAVCPRGYGWSGRWRAVGVSRFFFLPVQQPAGDVVYAAPPKAVVHAIGPAAVA